MKGRQIRSRRFLVMTVAYSRGGGLAASRRPIIAISFYRFAVIAVTAVAVLAPLALIFYQSFLTRRSSRPIATFQP